MVCLSQELFYFLHFGTLAEKYFIKVYYAFICNKYKIRDLFLWVLLSLDISQYRGFQFHFFIVHVLINHDAPIDRRFFNWILLIVKFRYLRGYWYSPPYSPL